MTQGDGEPEPGETRGMPEAPPGDPADWAAYTVLMAWLRDLFGRSGPEDDEAD